MQFKRIGLVANWCQVCAKPTARTIHCWKNGLSDDFSGELQVGDVATCGCCRIRSFDDRNRYAGVWTGPDAPWQEVAEVSSPGLLENISVMREAYERIVNSPKGSNDRRALLDHLARVVTDAARLERLFLDRTGSRRVCAVIFLCMCLLVGAVLATYDKHHWHPIAAGIFGASILIGAIAMVCAGGSKALASSTHLPPIPRARLLDAFASSLARFGISDQELAFLAEQGRVMELGVWKVFKAEEVAQAIQKHALAIADTATRPTSALDAIEFELPAA